MSAAINIALLENKQFAYACLNLMQEHGLLDDATINTLTSIEACQHLFHCSSKFAVLQEVPLNCSEADLYSYCHDCTGKQRYYKGKITAAKRTFVVTNHWYGPNKSMPDNRTPFLGWVMGRVAK